VDHSRTHGDRQIAAEPSLNVPDGSRYLLGMRGLALTILFIYGKLSRLAVVDSSRHHNATWLLTRYGQPQLYQ
jgi:hypothetical protein